MFPTLPIEISTPRTDLDNVGDPRRIALDSITVEKLGSIGYDWTPWDDSQLREMERIWDQWAAFYRRLIPPNAKRGINLGTHNGAIQKALQRSGFDMYGIECNDHIDDLHRYGCRGERGNFFCMPQIASDSYDFAIIDRALCNTREQSWYVIDGRRQEKDRIQFFTDLDGRNLCDGPPFFDEAERIVRPGGVLIVAFRPFVSRIWIDDLARRGALSVLIDDRKHPYYICALTVGSEPKAFKSLARFVDEAATHQEIIRPENQCARIRTAHGETSFIYIPDNRYITISYREGTWKHVPLFDFPGDTRMR
jgi:hypothetical protein